jgi:hypothetical protein
MENNKSQKLQDSFTRPRNLYNYRINGKINFNYKDNIEIDWESIKL